MTTPPSGDANQSSPPETPAAERRLSAAQRERMQQIAREYAQALPGRDTDSLATGLKAKLVYTDLGERDGAYDPEHGVILISRRASPQRQRFTLAHEVSHALLLGDDDLLSELHDRFEGQFLEDAIETLCNVGAAAILLPDELLNEVLRRYGPSGRAMHALSRLADVSVSSAMYALASAAAGPILFAICSRLGVKSSALGLSESPSLRQKEVRSGAQRPVVVRSSAETRDVKYSLSRDTRIPEDHPVVVALDTGFEHGGRSYVPFRSGRKVPAFVDAYPDDQRRVLVSFRLDEKKSE
ncbi:ImmA/IrrE family metallo-endopeptidase [Deinococcus sp. KNUC1210]|uniref:ImmA/IrrE family metallo-endopeptidase n=1 Tax=Deinococcus sp. KNUC1210 TaxID=2917691 RepID=UPI001EF002A3|nr:ImmA/IrrE family metallo-endopeptidase [Deinococcus sp. KNUC1210]ULH14994.1 ImmA/IrrE family metallo-endopeptidase [Deinococcus sp. KNUC1210]